MVLNREEIALVVVQGVANHRLVPLRTQHDADWRIVTLAQQLPLEVMLVHSAEGAERATHTFGFIGVEEFPLAA